MALQLPVVQTGLEASIQAAMKSAGKGAVINLGNSAKQISSLSQPLGRITGQADQFTKSMEAANARVFAFGASVGIINSVTKAFNGVLQSTIEVEASLANIYSVLDKTGSNTQEFENGLFQAAKNAGQSFKVAADAALELSRQGLNSQDVLKRLNDTLILTRLSGLDSAAAVEGLSAAYNSFSGTGITTTEILNKLVAVSQKYAVSEKDLIEGIKRAGSTAQQAGVSFDELAALITAVQERTARGGAVIGNSFKTIFARLQDKGTLEYLSNLGIGVVDLQGKVLPATAIMEGLAAKFNDFSQIGQADIAEKLGGIYQLGNLLAALQDLSSEQSKYTGAIKVSAAAADQAYQKNAALNNTLESILNRVSVSAQQLGATLGELGVTDNLKSILDFFNKLLDGIQSILQEDSGIGKFFKGLVAGIGNLISGPGLALFGAIILKLSKDLVQFGFSSLKSFFGIGQAAKQIADVEKSVAQALSTNVSLQQRLLALEGDRAAQLRIISSEIINQEAMLRKIASTSAAIAPGLYGAGVRSTGQGLRVPKAADGYMPAVSQEASSINRGVGGAKASDKPVVIPNFNFGGGKRGTMVANSGEHLVPNFNGSGGSAIFNRDMVRKMGMPSGAQKINSAGGFVPNYAKKAIENINTKDKQLFGIGGLQGKELTYAFDRYIVGYESEKNGDQKTAPYVLAGRIFESRLQGLKYIDLQENSPKPDIQIGGFRISEAKLSGKAAYEDPKFGVSELMGGKGNRLVLPSTSSKEYDEKLEKNKGAKINRKTGISHNSLFGEARRIIEKYKNTPRQKIVEQFKNRIPIAANGFIPNFAISQREAAYNAWDSPLKNGKTYDFVRTASAQSGTSLNKTKAIEISKALDLHIAQNAVQIRDDYKSNKQESVTTRRADTTGAVAEFGMIYPSNSKGSVSSFLVGSEREVVKGIPIIGKPSDDLYPEVEKGIINAGMNYAKNLGFNPDIIQEERFAAGIKSNLNPGTIEAAFGTVFESVFQSAMKVPPNIGQTFDLPSRPKLNSFIGSMERGGILKASIANNINPEMLAADFKNDLSDPNLSSMAQKIKAFRLKQAVRGNTTETSARGFIPNFANTTVALGKDPEYARRQRERSAKAQKYRSASGTIGNLFKVLPEKFFADLVLGDAGYGIETEGIFKTIKDSAMYSASFAGPNAVKFVQSAESYGLKVSKTLQDKLAKLLVKATTKSGAKGFLPNFADPVQAAIGREMSAGVPASQIYIDQNASLKSAMNPNGLMVANRIDEPMGGIQGIARARKEGANPMTYGAARGFIPNYADPNPELTSFAGMTRGDALAKINEKLIKDLQALDDEIIKATDAQAKSTQALVTTKSKTEKQVNKLTEIMNASTAELSTLNEKKSQTQSEANKNKTAVIDASTGILGRETKVSKNIGQEKQSKDSLGAIFAVQGALSVLEGVVGETTGTFSSLIKGATSLASTITTTVFAVQGLSSMGGAFGSVSKALGPLAIGATVLFGLFQEGGKIADEWNGVTSSAALALEKVSKAAESAAVKLTDYSPAEQEKIRKEAEKRFIQATSSPKTITSMGADYKYRTNTYDVPANIEGWTEALKKSINEQIAMADAAGVASDDVSKIFQNVTKDGKISKEGANAAAIQLEDKIYSTKKYSTLLDSITFDSPDAAKFLGTPSEFDAAKNSKGANDKFMKERNLLSGLNDQAKNKLFDKTRTRLSAEKDAFDKQQNDSYKEKNQALEKYLQNLAAENLYQIKITNFSRISAEAETSKLKELSSLSNDLTVSAEDRSKIESLINLKYQERADLVAKQLNTLTSSKSTIEEGLKTSFTVNPLTKPTISENLPNVLNENQDLFLRIASLKDEAAIAKTSLDIAKAFKIEEAEAAIIAKDMALSFIEIGKNIKKSNDELSITTVKNKEILLIDLQKQKATEQINRDFQKYSNSLDIILNARSVQNIAAQSSIKIDEMRKDNTLSNPNTFSGITTQAGRLEKTQQIEKEFFEKRMQKQKEIEERQSSVDFAKKILTQDNIKALNANTDKLGKLITELENQVITEKSLLFEQELKGGYLNTPATPETETARVAINSAIKESKLGETQLTKEQSQKFFGKDAPTLQDWNKILTNIAFRESEFNPKKLYKEETVFDNQKRNVISTGLFQISPESVNGWRAKSGKPDITQEDLLDPRKNALYAAEMMKQMIEGSGGVLAGGTDEKSYQGLSKYWSVMRRERATETAGLTVNSEKSNISNLDTSAASPFRELGRADEMGQIATSLSVQNLDASKLSDAINLIAKNLTKTEAAAVIYSTALTEEVAKRNISTASINAETEEFKEAQSLAKNKPILTFKTGVEEGLSDLDDQVLNFQYKFGKEIPQLFSNGLASAIEGALDGTKSLKESLMDAATSFLKAISSKSISNMADMFTQGLGNIIPGIGTPQGKATGGYIRGGSGSKDDVPAMLMGGEYVINKKSVNKYGPAFLEAINSGSLDGYAKGGKVKDYFTPGTYGVKQMTTKDDLLGFATQEYTSGSKDKISSGNGFASVSLEPESVRLTNFGRRNSPQAQRAKDVRKQMFGIYIDEMRKAAELKKQEEEEKKARKKAFTNALIMAGVSIAGSALVGGAMSGFKNAFSTSKLAGGTFTKNAMSGLGGMLTGGGVDGLQGNNYGGILNMFSKRGGVTDATKYIQSTYGKDFIGPIQESQKVNAGNNTNSNQSNANGLALPYGGGFIDPRLFAPDFLEKYTPVKRATGGSISQTAGIDTIPTMLSGGEFIMNKAAAENIGPGNLQAMNAGASKPVDEKASRDLNDKLISKFDELIGTTEKSTGSITINVDGSTGKSSEASSGETQSSNQQLSRQIKDAVLKVIQEEKRLGGQLRRGM